MTIYKPIVLLVHGMGTHRAKSDPITNQNKAHANISDEFIAGLNEAGARFGLKTTDENGNKSSYNIADHIALHEFNYSNFLDEIRQKITFSLAEGQDSNQIKNLLKSPSNGAGLASKLISGYSAFGQDEMIYTHWLDVILYASTYWGEAIRVRLLEKLNELFRDTYPRDIHIICHSLGTSVVHDTLWKIYNKKFTGKKKDLHKDIQISAMKLASLWTFANVSNLTGILNSIGKPNDDVVRPGAEGCTMTLNNVHNKFDPFTWFKSFKPKQNGAFYDYEIKDVRKANTHDFKEYVTVPEVARQLILTIDPTVLKIKSKALASAREKYSKTTLNNNVTGLESALVTLKSNTNVQNVESVMSAYKTLEEKIKTLAGDL